MRKVYFAIVFDPASGFADQLGQLITGRKLGLSLGYVYFHRQIVCPRRAWNMQPLNWPGFLTGLTSRIVMKCGRIFRPPGVWNYWGLNSHLARQAKAQGQEAESKCKRMRIALNDRILGQNDISTLEELKAYVRQAVSGENSSDRPPLLLNIFLSYPMDSLRSIVNLIPDSIDDLDLSAIYSAHRHKRLRDSNYPKQGLKTLVHVRQGDVAAVKTPWNTWIYWPRGEVFEKRRWRECRDESEFSQLTVADFHCFTKGILSRFADNAFAVQTFSDGFERTFYEIHKHNDNNRRGLGLTSKQMNSLLQYRRRYAREFEFFKKMKNSRLTVGEWPSSKFHKFIDAVLTANLLIVAFPRQMTAFHIRRCFSSAGYPPTVLLYKPVAEKQMRDFLENNRSDKIIPVNISAPDFDRTSARLVELLPSLAPAYRPRLTPM